MIRLDRWAVVLFAALLVSSMAVAQVPTGTLTGRVETAEGSTLPGVTVTASSPRLQGTRSAISGANGDYKIGFLPAGLYEVTYELEGFNSVAREIRVNAAQTAVSDISMGVADVAEEIVVTGNLETISETPTISTTISADELDSLAVARNIEEAVDLVPGVHRTGPIGSGAREGNISISGAMSFENLWLINGVVVNENVRGQSLDLFIEDAIQETTVSTGSVSAEYGRFTGGVVNVLTKSGGNAFNGSLRASLTNQDWESSTPLTTFKEDKINETYEGTFGGRIIRDRLWFFLAGRDITLDEAATLPFSNTVVSEGREQQRYEGKLTLNVTQSHSLVGTYLEIDQSSTNFAFLDVLEPRALTDRSDPQELWSAYYSGVFGSNLFLEAQYSEREFNIGVGGGGPRDLVFGSTWETTVDSTTWWSPFFCGECEEELRNNENALVKASYFLSTESVGTHDIAFGYDTFTDITFDVNHQSGSDFRLASDGFLIDPNSGEVYTVLDPVNGDSWVAVWPVFGLDNVAKTDFETNSFYVNDRWQLNDKWSFNLGVRFDENNGTDAGGKLSTDDSKVSPRVGLSYDFGGDGDLVLNASAGTYVAAVANNIADSTSTGGAIGREIIPWGNIPGAISFNTDPNCITRGDCVPTADVTSYVIDRWLEFTGFNPLTDPPEDIASLPGTVGFLIFPSSESNRGIVDTIKSPSADELTVGMTKRLGTKGLVRADLVYRDWTDFYSDRITTETGQVILGGNPADFEQVGNYGNDKLDREYTGLHVQGRYRFTPRLTLAGSYALSNLEGNINGETSGSGPISFDPNRYPEYKSFAANNPVGDLGADQRHKARVWAIYNVLQGEHHNLSVSWLQNYLSGTPYGALGGVDSRPFVNNPGYIGPDQEVNYYFTARDAFTTDNITSSDIALNYSFGWNAWGKQIEVFIAPEILNLFDEDSVIDVDTAVDDETNSALAPFNPFTETPVQGEHWNLGEDFGQPISELDYQRPRTFRVSVGFRF